LFELKPWEAPEETKNFATDNLLLPNEEMLKENTLIQNELIQNEIPTTAISLKQKILGNKEKKKKTPSGITPLTLLRPIMCQICLQPSEKEYNKNSFGYFFFILSAFIIFLNGQKKLLIKCLYFLHICHDYLQLSKCTNYCSIYIYLF
jgi:hypothetical protein